MGGRPTLARAWLGNRLWQLSSWPESRRFQGGLYQLRRTQEQLLHELLGRQASTIFGQRHALKGIASYAEFAERVPLSSYESLLEYLPGGLSHDPVKVWEPTGGSMGGSKWIPWTARLQGEFRRAVALWIWHLFRQYPGIVGGRGYWQLTPKVKIPAPLWLTQQNTGFQGDGDYLGPLGRWLERSVLLSVPPGPDLWRQNIEALRRAGDLRLISCWSPSFLICLHDRFCELLGAWEPERWWPELQVVSCWTAAASASYVPRIRELFPGVAIQPKGLLSTEAVVTVPVGDRYPLAFRSHFFEFAIGDRVIPSWQLRLGQEAGVIVSTGAGLTRYITADRIRVTGFMGEIPCLEFAGRDGVSDQRGEKLAFSFLESLLQNVPGFSMLAFEGDGYTLFVDSCVSIEERALEIADIEALLMDSFTYRDCRALGQLQPLRGFLVEGDALAQYEHICSAQLGQRQGCAKAQAFHPYQGWSRAFAGRFL